MPRQIVRGQRVAPIKAARAKELRRRMTRAEAALWQQLRRNQLDGIHFRRQQVIDGFIVDFYCDRQGLVIEVDGEVHLDQKCEDFVREQALQRRGLTILRLANDDVLNDIVGVLRRIRRALT